MAKYRPRISSIIDPSLHNGNALGRTGERLVQTADGQADQPRGSIRTLNQRATASSRSPAVTA